MRSCVIQIENETYVPVRAIPYCTAGLFEPMDVLLLLTHPESHADSNYSANIVAYVIDDGNELTYQQPNTLARFKYTLDSVIRNGCTYLEQVTALPPNMLVKATEMFNFNGFIDDLNTQNVPTWCKSHTNDFSWQDSPFITSEECAVIFEGLEHLIFANAIKPRKNSANETRKKIMIGVATVERICKEKGIRFSKDHIPGHKYQLYDCLLLIDPTIDVVLSTFIGKEYSGKLNLKWKQGERHQSGDAMVTAVKLQMGVI